MRLIALIRVRKGCFQRVHRKIFRKKVVETLAGLKERRTFAPAIEKQRWLLSDSETIFEDIYIIRQVVQESESSISMRVPSMKMTLGYDG